MYEREGEGDWENIGEKTRDWEWENIHDARENPLIRARERERERENIEWVLDWEKGTTIIRERERERERHKERKRWVIPRVCFP